MEDGGKRSFDPAKDMAGLREAIKRKGGAKLVIIDPIAMVAVKIRIGTPKRAVICNRSLTCVRRPALQRWAFIIWRRAPLGESRRNG